MRSRAGTVSPTGTQAHAATTTGNSRAAGRASDATPHVSPTPRARPGRGAFTHAALAVNATSISAVNVVSGSRSQQKRTSNGCAAASQPAVRPTRPPKTDWA